MKKPLWRFFNFFNRRELIAKFRCDHPVAKTVFSTNKREVHSTSGTRLFTSSKLIIPAIVEYEDKDVRFRKDLSNELDEWIMHSGRFALFSG